MSHSIDSNLLEQVKSEVAELFPTAVTTLENLVRVPGIAWEAFDAQNLERSAEAVADLFRATGLMDWVEIRRAPKPGGGMGSPAVLGKRAAKNGRPQILLYAHHDVQPPGDETIWKSPAFEPTIRNGRMYGRGAADDKAGIVAHLSALKVLASVTNGDPDVGITLFIEGEEEAGSPSFRNFLEQNQKELEADVIIVADSGNWTLEIPALTTTLRGLVSQEITVATLDHAVHSGMYGGVVPDAMTAMIRLLASLHAANGDVAVAGLVNRTASDLAYSEESLRTDSGLLDGVEQIGTGSILDRNWMKPAITVIGIDYPSVAVSSNTLIPSVKAAISMRIAPGQEPEAALALLRKHLEANLPWGAKLSYGEIEMGKPFESDANGWAKQHMQAALSAGFGNDAVDIGIGGSIPFIADLVELFPSAQILVSGVEDPDGRAHSPNESVDLEMLRKVMVSEALFLISGNQLSK